MAFPDFKQNYFELFSLPVQFAVDSALLGEHYRQLQQELHPDRYASAPAQQQRVAVQYSALVNQAYATLNKPLARALYLLELAGMSQEQISAEPVDGGFLIEQMELREKLESLHDLVDPDTVLGSRRGGQRLRENAVPGKTAAGSGADRVRTDG
jgi:molecular chaperone HscB